MSSALTRSAVDISWHPGYSSDSLHAAGSTLDVTAMVALIGWTIVELVVVWAVGIFRREPA